MSGDALAVETQYLRPSPRRFWIPKGNEVAGQRLCTDNFCGCCLCKWLVLYLELSVEWDWELLEMDLIALLKFSVGDLLGTERKPYWFRIYVVLGLEWRLWIVFCFFMFFRLSLFFLLCIFLRNVLGVELIFWIWVGKRVVAIYVLRRVVVSSWCWFLVKMEVSFKWVYLGCMEWVRVRKMWEKVWPGECLDWCRPWVIFNYFGVSLIPLYVFPFPVLRLLVLSDMMFCICICLECVIFIFSFIEGIEWIQWWWLCF